MPSGSGGSTEDTRAFLQSRVALFSRLMATIGLVGIALQTFSLLLQDFHWSPFALTAATTAAPATAWLACRTGKRSILFLRVAETSALIFAALAVFVLSRFLVPLSIELIAHVVPESAGAEIARTSDSIFVTTELYVAMSTCVGLTQAFTLRAALVPTHPLHSAMLTGCILLPMVAVTGFGIVPSPTADLLASHATLESRALVSLQFGIW